MSARPKPDSDLGRAADALEREQLGAAMSHLLAAWRRYPEPARARVIEKLGALASRRLPSLADEPLDVWLDLAASLGPLHLDRLLAALDRQPIAGLKLQLDALQRFAPDPRLAIAVVDAATRFGSHSAGPARTRAFAIAELCGDPRSRRWLEAAIAQNRWTPDAIKRASKLVAKLAPPPAPSRDPALKRIASALTCLRTSKLGPEAFPQPEPAAKIDRERELLEAVFADPSADEPRVVLGDWWAERGDPRGEFMQLQLARRSRKLGRAEQKRERELLGAHLDDWLGPLREVVELRSARFERGFLSAAKVSFATARQRELIGHPMFSTIEDLETTELELLVHPVLRAMTRATAGPEALSLLASRPEPVALSASVGPTTMDYGIRRRAGLSTEDPDAWAAALEVGALTDLRSLSVAPRYRGATLGEGTVDAKSLQWLWSSQLGRQLQTLDIDARHSHHHVAGWIPVMRANPALERVTIRHLNENTAGGTTNILSVFVLERDGPGLTLRLQMSFAFQSPYHYFSTGRQLEADLAGFPRRELPRLRIEYVGSKKCDLSRYAEVRDDLRGCFEEIELPTSRTEALVPPL